MTLGVCSRHFHEPLFGDKRQKSDSRRTLSIGPAEPSGMHAPPIMWRAWGRGMPRVIGRRWLPSATGSQKENADPASPATVVRQPRHRELFSLPWQRRRRRAGHWAVHVPWSRRHSALAFQARRFISQAWRVLDGFILELLTLDRIAFASLNSVHDCPPCGGDARIIRQVRRCRITFPDFSRPFS